MNESCSVLKWRLKTGFFECIVVCEFFGGGRIECEDRSFEKEFMTEPLILSSEEAKNKCKGGGG